MDLDKHIISVNFSLKTCVVRKDGGTFIPAELFETFQQKMLFCMHIEEHMGHLLNNQSIIFGMGSSKIGLGSCICVPCDLSDSDVRMLVLSFFREYVVGLGGHSNMNVKSARN